MTPRNHPSRDTAPHPSSSNRIEDRLRARHVSFTLEPNLPLDGIVVAEGHQVRLIEHRAPSDMVTRYAEQMKAGAVFPAIVINDRGELIDGNTRRLAAIKAGRTVIAAYICSEMTALEARSLSVELNQCHGLSMTETEIHAFVTGAVHEGQTLDTKSYARMTGVRASTLARWMAQANFQRRATRQGIPAAIAATLSQSAQAALNGVRLTSVFVNMTELASVARISVNDLRALVAAVNAATSEAEAAALVSAERRLRRNDIRAVASGFTTRRSSGKRSAMHVAALLKLEVDDLLDVVPDKKDEAVARLRRLRDHIGAAVSTADARWGLAASDDSDMDDTVSLGSQLCGHGAPRG